MTEVDRYPELGIKYFLIVFHLSFGVGMSTVGLKPYDRHLYSDLKSRPTKEEILKCDTASLLNW